MNPEIVSQLVNHTDADAVSLAIAACEAIPEEATPLLVLADRLAELGDLEREHRARRLANLLHEQPTPCPGFGPRTAELVFDYLPLDDASLSAWLALRWMLPLIPSDDPASVRVVRSIQLAALGPLGLSVGLGKLDPFEEEAWVRFNYRTRPQFATEARNDLRGAATSLLLTGTGSDPTDRQHIWDAVEAGISAFRFYSPTASRGTRRTAPMRFRHLLGNIIELVTKTPLRKVEKQAIEKLYYRRERERSWEPARRFQP